MSRPLVPTASMRCRAAKSSYAAKAESMAPDVIRMTSVLKARAAAVSLLGIVIIGGRKAEDERPSETLERARALTRSPAEVRRGSKAKNSE